MAQYNLNINVLLTNIDGDLLIETQHGNIDLLLRSDTNSNGVDFIGTSGKTVDEVASDIRTHIITYAWDSSLLANLPLNGYFTVSGYTVAPLVTTVPIGMSVTTSDVTPTLSITSINTLLEVSSDPCSLVKVEIGTSDPITEITSPISETFASTTLRIFEFPRGQYNLDVEVTDGSAIGTTVWGGVPPKVVSEDIDFTQVNQDIYISFFSEGNINAEFKLDDGTYQQSNVFIGVTPGSHMIYLKDQYGCEVFKSITVEDNSVDEDAYILLPKENSIRFKEINDLLPNDENLLSYESLDEIHFKEDQIFKSDDLVTVQMRSSYQPTIENCAGQQTNLTKVSEFMNLRECLDAKCVDVGSGYVSVYFTTGNTYTCGDFTTPTGSYSLNGSLPAWARIGQIIVLENGSSGFISSIDFNSELGVRTFKIQTDQHSNGIIKMDVSYNLFMYEIWETVIDMSTISLTNGDQFLIRVVTPGGEKQWLSEHIAVKNDTSNLALIEYWRSENTNMYYASGIKNRMWLYIDKYTAQAESNVESYMTDETVLQIDYSNYEVEQVAFAALTKEVARNLVRAATCDNFYINDIKYVQKSATMEQEENSNLYSVVLTLYKTGKDPYIDQFDQSLIKGVKIIEGGNSFIKQ